MECPKCGGSISLGIAACSFCGTPLAATPQANQQQFQPAPPQNQQPAVTSIEQAIPGFSALPVYYQIQFRKIYESHEVYKGKFNWYPFFFTVIWAFTKGLWLSGILWFIASAMTGGVLGFVAIFYYGYRGNYLYYQSLKTGQQPWI